MAEHYKVDEDEERRLIVDKYEKGREKILKGEGVPDYEDPKNEFFQSKDRYGFIHDEALKELSEHDNKQTEIEIRRSNKWLKMIRNWSDYKNNKYDKLRERVFKGIPNSMRGSAWLLLLEVPKIKEENPNRYDEMYNLGKQFSKEVRQIDLDVNRTFRNNEMFRERYNVKQQELFKVLVAYSVYNPEVGYCQGMSQLAALLLMFFTSEEDTFWALDRLMTGEKYAMHGFFVPGFPKLERFARHHDLILKKFQNKIYKHFRKFDIESTLYTLKWFFQCFLDRVPFSLTLRLWDCFMIDGERILTCMSYTLLKLHKKTILKKNMDELIPFLQIDLEKDFGYRDDIAIAELQKSIQDLQKYKMDVPKEKASDKEKPSQPFGLISQRAETVSIINDDRSVVESMNSKPFNDADNSSDTSKNTSKTGSAIDINEYKEDIIDESDPMSDLYKRKLSVYDNVDLNESFEAAKNLVDNELSGNERTNQKQSNDNQSNNHEAIIHNADEINNTLNTKQFNGQKFKYNQEKSSTFIVNDDKQESAVDNEKVSESNGAEDCIEKENSLKRQTKTSSFKDKLVKRKSSIPTMKRNDSQRKSNRKSMNKSLNENSDVNDNQTKLDKKTEFNRSQSINGNDKNLDKKQSDKQNADNKTPSKTSLIPRLSSPLNSLTKSARSITPTDLSESAKLNDKSFKQSNIPINSSTITNVNLSNSTTTTSSDKVTMYVPFSSKNNGNSNSKNGSLDSSTNSINNINNGLRTRTKQDDLNKITINVNQKFNSNESNPMQRKSYPPSYLPTIDT